MICSHVGAGLSRDALGVPQKQHVCIAVPIVVVIQRPSTDQSIADSNGNVFDGHAAMSRIYRLDFGGTTTR